jgi:hypothetical protein
MSRYALLVPMLWTALTALAAVKPLDPAKEPVKDQSGNVLYMLLLDEEIASREPAGDEPAPVSTRHPAVRENFRSWHRANVRHLVKRIEADYQITATNMTSWALPSFSAYLTPSVVAKIEGEPRVRLALPIYKGDVQFAAWGDYWDGSELVSWGKQAVGADDSASTANIVYLIDGNAVPHSDLPGLVFPPNAPNQGFAGAPGHATHIAGILAADRNNAMVRGINPGATVINVPRGGTDPDVAAAFDWVLADAEQQGIFAVANFSTNSHQYAAGGSLDFIFRRISNRVLIVQAAGNRNVDACQEAYGPGNPRDGILVVGGTDEDDAWSGSFDNTPSGYGSSAGSNTGSSCIEVWAPSQRIVSTWNTSPTATMQLSGTSMAAPHVSGLAARYGTTSTRPYEREQFISGISVSTGNYDPAGALIYKATLAAGNPPVPHRIAAVAVTANATAPGTSPNNVNDGLYLTGSWNAGHGAPAWIELDLGNSTYVSAVRMVPEQSPAGPVTHHVYAGNTPNPTTLVGTYSGIGWTLEGFAVDVLDIVRYVRIHTVSSPSWVAWREIEVYGF